MARREKYEQRLADLKAVRNEWESTWKDITEQFIPYGTSWDSSDRGGRRKDSHILNNTPIDSVNTNVAGMMAGVTSPVRDWWGLQANSPSARSVSSVKLYLDSCRKIINAELQASNWYSELANGIYPQLATIGTGAMFMEETKTGRFHFRTMPVGEYYLDTNSDGDVDVCFRELVMTVRQIVEKFGIDSVSIAIKNAYDNGKYNVPHTVIHAIVPNTEYEPGKDGRAGKRFYSCWFEQSSSDKDKFLREGGYDEFPVLAPRWSVRPGDVYGRGPGWVARGDAKSLQYQEERLLRMLDKIVNPPLRVSAGIKRVSLIPGDLTAMPRGENAMAEPIMQIDPNSIAVMRDHIARTEDRVKRAMYVHLWNNMVDDSRNQRPTATEVEARRQEVMLMLGPLLENLNGTLLKPMIERAFAIMDRNGRLPEPPPELGGEGIGVEFVSIMHQMQQSTGLIGIQTLVQQFGMLAQLTPQVLDKLNSDAIADDIARITGVRPDSVLDDDQVAQIRQARAEQEQARQMAEQAQPITKGVKNLSEVDDDGLRRLASSLSPVAAASGGALEGVM